MVALDKGMDLQDGDLAPELGMQVSASILSLIYPPVPPHTLLSPYTNLYMRMAMQSETHISDEVSELRQVA